MLTVFAYRQVALPHLNDFQNSGKVAWWEMYSKKAGGGGRGEMFLRVGNMDKSHSSPVPSHIL